MKQSDNKHTYEYIYKILDNRTFLEKTDTIYHYTSLEALQKILSSKSLHLTDCAFMSDYSEFEFGINVFQNLMKTHYHEEEELKAIEGFDVIKNIKYKNRVFIGAFTSLKDSLNQWRSYALQATGAAIGINVNKIDRYCIDHDLPFGSVIYSDSFDDIFRKLFKMIMPFISDVLEDKDEPKANEVLRIMFGNLLGMTSFMKHPGFKEEEEIRVVVSALDRTVEKKFNNGLYIPYVELDFGGSLLEMVDEIWIGPAAKQELVKRSVDLMVKECGIADKCEIKVSSIPYRLLS